MIGCGGRKSSSIAILGDRLLPTDNQVSVEQTNNPSRLGRFYAQVNKPFGVTVIGGLIIFAVSVTVQNLYWWRQQQFLLDQARIERVWEGARTAEEETVKALGRRLAATASVIAAHENGYEFGQHLEAVKRYDTANEEWDEAEETIKFHLADYFPDQEIKKQWDLLTQDLHVSHEDIAYLEEHYKTTDRSRPHDDQIAKCWSEIAKVETDLEKLNRNMIQRAERGAP